ncbi:MAG: magnesium transporter [Candidatus Diapherotrites archaeon]|uniref:Magnesium transporter n=1 Tax=Candidatus Iainarchaeum sp. TaxID=3101447 RepID=A0A8T4LDP7_9ARCH|nr:magnesium transporter [Candidatus Diapherotrites archaeon]
MKTIREHLEELRQIKRKEHHPLVHEIHVQHRISKKTLFYVKEYGPHSHIAHTIIKESWKILLFASVLSSFGGFALEQIKEIFISISPLIILLPALNGLIGDLGTIISSNFSTFLHEGKIGPHWWKNPELRKLFGQLFVIAVLFAGAGSLLAIVVSQFVGNAFDTAHAYKIFLIAFIDVVMLVVLLSLVAILAGLYFYHKGEDPNNFLIPITTSVADFGNMLLLVGLVILFF